MVHSEYGQLHTCRRMLATTKTAGVKQLRAAAASALLLFRMVVFFAVVCCNARKAAVTTTTTMRFGSCWSSTQTRGCRAASLAFVGAPSRRRHHAFRHGHHDDAAAKSMTTGMKRICCWRAAGRMQPSVRMAVASEAEDLWFKKRQQLPRASSLSPASFPSLSYASSTALSTAAEMKRGVSRAAAIDHSAFARE